MECIAVMPAYNEAACIREVCLDWLAVLGELPSAQLLVVDDGSRDGTASILDNLAAEHGSLLVRHQPNQGHGGALLCGYLTALDAGCEWVFQVDSDGQLLARDFFKLWDQRGKSDFIVGCRCERKGSSIRRLLSQAYRLLVLLVYGVRLRDPNVPFRLMRARLLTVLLKAVPGTVFAPNAFLSILAKRCGQAVLEIPVKHLPRRTGKESIRKTQLPLLVARCAKELILFRFTYKRGLRAVTRSSDASSGER